MLAIWAFLKMSYLIIVRRGLVVGLMVCKATTKIYNCLHGLRMSVCEHLIICYRST